MEHVQRNVRIVFSSSSLGGFHLHPNGVSWGIGKKQTILELPPRKFNSEFFSLKMMVGRLSYKLPSQYNRKVVFQPSFSGASCQTSGGGNLSPPTKCWKKQFIQPPQKLFIHVITRGVVSRCDSNRYSNLGQIEPGTCQKICQKGLFRWYSMFGGFHCFLGNRRKYASKRTPTYPWKILQASPNPQKERIPS